MASIDKKIMNLFDVTKFDREQITLQNIAIGANIFMDVALPPISAKEERKKAMDIFLEKILISGKVSV